MLKKLLYWILLLLLCSCSDKENILFSISCSELSFSWENGRKEIIIETNSSWHISAELPTWLSLSKMEGDKGTTSLYITISNNESDYPRTCNITFTISSQEKSISIIQRPKESLHFADGNEYNIDPSGTQLSINIIQTISYGFIISENAREWIIPVDSQTGILNSIADNLHKKTLTFNVAENPTKEVRRAEIIIYNKAFNLSDTLHIIQASGNVRHYDGECTQLQKAPLNNINLIIIGDGFTRKDLNINGRYENIMKQAANYFFSIEPYKSYRDFFNVYMVVAESAEEGVNEKKNINKIKNKFNSTYGEGSEITCNSDLVFEFAHKVKELPENRPLTIIVVLNSTKYAGTTYLYSNGNSIALCPMSAEESPNDFEGLIHHEAGGHGFGFLCDEYVYYKKEIPESRKQNIKEWQELGFQMNLDFTNNTSTILWKDFIGLKKYSQTGVYEGGYEYQYGVWRSEENSCMNNNIPYYNVQSRWSIVNRIMRLSNKPFTIQDFIETDHAILPNDFTRSLSPKATIPLGSPIWIK